MKLSKITDTLFTKMQYHRPWILESEKFGNSLSSFYFHENFIFRIGPMFVAHNGKACMFTARIKVELVETPDNTENIVKKTIFIYDCENNLILSKEGINTSRKISREFNKKLDIILAIVLKGHCLFDDKLKWDLPTLYDCVGLVSEIKDYWVDPVD